MNGFQLGEFCSPGTFSNSQRHFWLWQLRWCAIASNGYRPFSIQDTANHYPVPNVNSTETQISWALPRGWNYCVDLSLWVCHVSMLCPLPEMPLHSGPVIFMLQAPFQCFLLCEGVSSSFISDLTTWFCGNSMHGS